MSPVINEELCIGCGACVDVCPVNAITLDEEAVEIDSDACIECGACVDACPVSAITL